MLDNNLLINEIQLGVKLNECIHSNRRSDFSLMLAMLTDDAREFSEFLVPDGPEQISNSDEQQLRRLFDLPATQPTGLKAITDIDGYNESALANANNMTAVYLNNVLKPKAISFRDDAKHINSETLANTSLHTKKRYEAGTEKALPGNLSTNKLKFNANEWLKSVQESIVGVKPVKVYSTA